MKAKENEFHYKMVMSKYSVKDVAKLLGISTNAVYNKINGKTQWTLIEFFVLCDAFSLSYEEGKRVFLPQMLANSHP